MKIRYNTIFIPLLIICGFAVWYLGFREEKVAAARRLADRSLINIEELDIIELIRPDETIRIEKTGASGESGAGTAEDWRMTQPYEAGCDPMSLAGLIDGIFAVESERDIADVTEDRKSEYGLTDPEFRLRLASTSGRILMDLAIGHKNASGTARYGAFADSTSAFLIPIYYIEPFDINPDTLRDTRALVFDPDNLVAIQLSSVEADIHFEKDDSTWMVTRPQTFPASPARLGILFQNIRELCAVEFLPDDADDPELRMKSVKLVVTSADGVTGELTLHGEDYTRGIFASSSWQPSPFIVDAYIYDRLALDPGVFFHVLLIEFPTESIERIHIRLPGSENLEFIRTGAGIEDWEILKPEGRLYTDPGSFENFINALLALQPEDRVPIPEHVEDYGLEPVFFMKIEVYRERDMGKAFIYLGSTDENGNYYATQDGQSYFTIAGELVDNFISANSKLKGAAD